MQQVFMAGNPDPLDNTATEYNSISHGGTWNATPANRSVRFPTTGRLRSLRVKLSAAPGTGNSYQFNVMKAVDGGGFSTTGITVTISDSATTGVDLVHETFIAVEDNIVLQVVPSSTPDAAFAEWSLIFEGDLARESVYMARPENTANSAQSNNTTALNGGLAFARNVGDVLMATPGTVKKLYARVDTASSGGDSWIVRIMKNGGASGITCTITDPAVENSDTTNTSTCAAGDALRYDTTDTGDPAATLMHLSAVYLADQDDESVIGLAVRADPASGDNFCTLTGNATFTTTESDARVLAQKCRIDKLYFLLNKQIGTGGSMVITLMKNGSATALTCTLGATGTTANDTSNSVDVADGDELSLRVNHTPGTANAYVLSFGMRIRRDSSGPILNTTSNKW